MLKPFEKVERILEAMRKRVGKRGLSWLEDIQFYDGYAEPGYTDPESGIIAVSNWNTIDEWDQTAQERVLVDTTPKVCGDLLEKIGVELEWEDEWSSCDGCNKLLRTSPDSYDWQMAGAYQGEDSGVLLCKNCIDPTEHLEGLENKANRCNTINRIKPEEHGYRRLPGEYTNGLREGRQDDPWDIAKALRKQGVKRFLFDMTDKDQFEIHFVVYVHESEWYLCDAEHGAACKAAGLALDTPPEILADYLEEQK